MEVQAQSIHDDNEPRPGEAGFSLVELLVVLAIIGMIATMVTPQVLGYLGRAKGETARIQIKNIGQALELYFLDLGTYPTTNEGLSALVAPPAGSVAWRGPYVRDAKGLTDPWGQPYLYRSPGLGNAPFEVTARSLAALSGEANAVAAR